MNDGNAQEKKPSWKIRMARHPPLVRLLTRLNVVLYRWSGGRIANEADGCPVCLVTMTGHRSGRRKTIALMYVPVDDTLLLVGSLGGAPQHPVWYHNLKAHPEIVVEVGREKRAMVAREVTGAERAALWPHAVAAFPPYADYQARTRREIPVFVCTAA